MKVRVTLTLGLCSVVAMAFAMRRSVRGQCGLHSSHLHLLADGGEPVPPWPKTGPSFLLADGGEPVPPWPKTGPGSNVLLG